ncbi:pyruvate, phosphate dikinase 2, partial [Tanacetum coccineum]
VMANADTPNDALTSRNNGVKGNSLRRTKHMFCSSDEWIEAVQKMIMAANLE